MKESLLFTGASGFLGKNIISQLKNNYDVTTIGIDKSDDIHANIASEIPSLTKHFDYILHAAGKAHSYPKTSAEIQSFYDVNLQGTINICRALEKWELPKAFIFISTLDVYGIEEGDNINESSPINPITHYAKSKYEAENFLIDWAFKNNIILGILRPALMVGPNPPGNLKTMINGIRKGFYVNINGGRTRKSLLMVQDIANVIPKVINKGGIYNLCDDRHPSYYELSNSIKRQLGIKRPIISIPFFIAKILAKVGDKIVFLPINSHKLSQLTKSNTYSNTKAKIELNWIPLDVLQNFKLK